MPFTASRPNNKPSPPQDSPVPLGLTVLQNMFEDDFSRNSGSFTGLTLTQMVEMRRGNQ